MKVFLVGINLVYPNTKSHEKHFVLAHQYLRAFVENQQSLQGRVEIFTEDYHIYQDETFISRRVLRKAPDVVGFSTFFWNIEKVIRISLILKRAKPSLSIIVGGPHISACPEAILEKNLVFDYVVRGEGEITFSELLHHLQFGRPALANIRGLTYWQNHKIRANPERKLIPDINTIPSPYLSGRLNIDFTRFRGLIETSRGCPYGCAYCRWTTRQMRFFSLERIQREISFLLDKGAARIFIIDSDLALHKRILKKLLHWLISLNSTTVFDCSFRIENLDKEELALIAEAPFDIFEIGLQSTNPIALRNIKRTWPKAEFEENFQYLKGIRDRKCLIVVDLITGLPGDNYETFKETLKYTVNMGPDVIHFFPLTILPGSELYNQTLQFGIQTTGDAAATVLSSATISLKEMNKIIQLCAAWYFNWLLERLSSCAFSILQKEFNMDRFYLIEETEAYFAQNPRAYHMFKKEVDKLDPLKTNVAEIENHNILLPLRIISDQFLKYLIHKYKKPEVYTLFSTYLSLDLLTELGH